MRLMTVVKHLVQTGTHEIINVLSNSQPLRALTAFSASFSARGRAAGDGVGRLLALRHTISHRARKIGSKIRKSGTATPGSAANRCL